MKPSGQTHRFWAFHLSAVAIIFALLIVVTQSNFIDTPVPNLDALRYVNYATSIYDYNVFGLNDPSVEIAQPGYANSPLYPWFLALVMHTDVNLVATFKCLLAHPEDAGACNISLGALVTAQYILVLAMMIGVWGTAFLLLQRVSLAWLATLLCFATTKPSFFANHVLTELMSLFLFALLMPAIVLAFRSARAYWWLICGILFGLLTLTRPEYRYVFYLLTLLCLAVSLLGSRIFQLRFIILFIVSFHCVIVPWQIRNYSHFGDFSITGGYADIILAQRTALNYMNTQEWLSAFIYWLPGFGEQIAKTVLPTGSYEKLGMGPDSYILKTGQEIFDRGLATVGDRDKLTAYIVRTEIIERPLQHIAVSIPLLWRGILAGKYLAAVGIFCLLAQFFVAVRKRDIDFIALCIIPIMLTSFYAAFSASIPRYNAYLIFYYAIAVAWGFAFVCTRLRARLEKTLEDKSLS